MRPEETCVGCPSCGAAKTSAADSRTVRVGWLEAKRRRRKCAECGHQYFTVEIPEAVAIEVFSED